MLKPVRLIDRLDRKFELSAQVGQPMAEFLKRQYIPSSAVIVKVNGRTADDARYSIQYEDDIEVRMVRAYQLPEYCEMLGLWEPLRGAPLERSDESIYTAQALWFNDNGICNVRESSMAGGDFIQWLERKFVDGILSHELVREGDHICLALSGGRDSLALLYLLQRTRKELPAFQLSGVTISPTAASDNDVRVATEAIRSLGVSDYTVLGMNYVNQTMRFSSGFETAIDRGLQTNGRGWSISLWHSVMRSNVERFCRDRGIRKIAFGYQHEDLLASLLRSQSLGISFGASMQKKEFGPFELVAPLWTITKKELTIYLEQVAPDSHSSQGSPTAYDRGDHNRDINYFLADTLSSICPGIGFTMFQGLADYNRRFAPKASRFLSCKNCGASYQNHNEEEIPAHNHLYCQTCSHFIALGEIRPIAIVTVPSEP